MYPLNVSHSLTSCVGKQKELFSGLLTVKVLQLFKDLINGGE